METSAARALWDTVGKAVVICIATILLLMWWTRPNFGQQPLPTLVTPPTAFVPHTQVENEYLDIVDEVMPGYLTPGNEDDVIAMGREWCAAMANGVDAVDALVMVDEQYGPEASDFAAAIMAAASAYFCPGEDV